MPFWNNKKSGQGSQPSPQPDPLGILREVVEQMEVVLDEMLSGEEKALTNVGMPVPIRTQSYVVETHYPFRLILPKFKLPSHLVFSVARGEHKSSYTNKLHIDIDQAYCIAGDVDTITRAQRTFEDHGLAAVLDQFAGTGIWLNRDPYGVYRYFEHYKHAIIGDQKSGNAWKIGSVKYWVVPIELRTVNGFSSAEIRQVERLWEKSFGILGDLLETSYRGDRVFAEDYVADGPRSFVKSHIVTGQKDHTDRIFLFQRELPAMGWWQLQWKLPALVIPSQTITLKLLPSLNVKTAVVEQFFVSLSNLTRPLAFAISSSGDRISFEIVCAPVDQIKIEHQVAVMFPDSVLDEVTESQQARGFSYEFVAKPRWEIPTLQTSFPVDPYKGLCVFLDDLPSENYTRIEIITSPLQPEVITEFEECWGPVTDEKKKKRVLERLRKLKEKLPAWMLAVRCCSSDRKTLNEIKNHFLRHYETPEQQWDISEITVSDNHSQRALDWSIVSTAELVALAHLPGNEVTSQRLELATMTSVLPPPLYTEPQASITVGVATHRKQIVTVTLPSAVRDKHVYAMGKAGSGKSTLLFNMALQDIIHGAGVAVIDPHGDLVEDLLAHIPAHRVEDVIYFDAAERERPIALNTMSAVSEDEVSLLADDLLVTFKRLSDSWGERMENILRHAIFTLLQAPNTTFLDIHRILQNEPFRNRVLKHVTHPLLRDFWEYEFPELRKDALQPILNRMSKFLLSPTLSGILGQRDSRLSFTDVLQNNKIFLANLAKGKIGEDSARLVGSVLVSQIQLAVMRRARLSKEERRPYFLYVDEFQNFTTSAFEVILSEARKYKLCLTLAHQYISQLDDKTRHAILGNVGTMILFAISGEDAARIKDQLGSYRPEDVVNLDPQKHEALCRPITKAADTFKFTTLAPPPRPAQNFVREIISQTKERYSSFTGAAPTDEPVDEQPPPNKPPVTPPGEPDAAKRPVADKPREGTIKEKILFFVSQAEYLSTAQIIELCFSHYTSEGSRKANASAALKELCESKQLKNQAFGRGNVYFVGRTPNITSHNLAVRDLYVKIVRSGFEIKEARFFFDGIPGLSPDLYVVFGDGGGEGIHTCWEYDTGTEGLAEIDTKVRRYQAYPYDRLTFIANTKQRHMQLAAHIQAPRTSFAILGTFQTLADPAFYGDGQTEPKQFFTTA